MRSEGWDHREWRRLLRRVRFVTRKSDEAEDLLHTAFLRLSEYSKTAKVENPGAFLIRTARNLAADQARHRRVRNEMVDGVDCLVEISDDRPLQSEALAAQERLRRVEAGLEQLGPRTREILLMHRLDGLKYQEIAARLGITASAVEKHVAKASLFLAGWVEGW